MHSEYDDQQDARDTAHEQHQHALDRRDRHMDHAPAGTPEPGLEGLPAHLRDDAPQWRCDRCKRITVAVSDGAFCGMPQPDESICTGTFRPLEVETSTVDVLPRDLDDHPQARHTVERLAELYDSIAIDRLPPLGALHWKLTCRQGNTAYVCRVTADGRLLSVQR